MFLFNRFTVNLGKVWTEFPLRISQRSISQKQSIYKCSFCSFNETLTKDTILE